LDETPAERGLDRGFVGDWTGEPILDILRGLEPAAIFPMHDRGKEHLYLEFARDLADLGFEQPVLCPSAQGDRFVFHQGKVRPD
jgi:hypothetical protein